MNELDYSCYDCVYYEVKKHGCGIGLKKVDKDDDNGIPLREEGTTDSSAGSSDGNSNYIRS